MEFYELKLDISEFCILCANLQGEFGRCRRSLKCKRLGKSEKDYFLNTFVPFFERLESIRLGRVIKYDLRTGEHFDI